MNVRDGFVMGHAHGVWCYVCVCCIVPECEACLLSILIQVLGWGFGGVSRVVAHDTFC